MSLHVLPATPARSKSGSAPCFAANRSLPFRIPNSLARPWLSDTIPKRTKNENRETAHALAERCDVADNVAY